DLADEYVYSDEYGDYDVGEINAVNCDKQGCEKWKNITDGCYKGCTYSDLYRSVERNSIMYTYVPVFNSVCQKHIKGLIEDYIKTEENIERALPKKSYVVNLKYNKGDVELKEVYLKPVKAGIEVKKTDYTAELKDGDESLFKTNLYFPEKIFPLPNSSVTAIIQEEFEFSLVLPYFPKTESLEIFRNDQKIAQTSLAVFSSRCGNNICESAENHLNCPKDCGIKDDFCQTSICDPDCPSQEDCEKSGIRRYVFPVSLIIISLILIIIVFFRSFYKPSS
ncbi:unnamed protein product, partial [marine sediment metagenome]